MELVLITGGSGLIGRHLTQRLLEKGYRVAFLSRNPENITSIPVYRWDPELNEIDLNAIEQADYIIHLAGAGVGDRRWTRKRRELILSSRVATCELLLRKTREAEKGIKAFISASGISYYGTITSDKIFSEADPPADDFLGEVCQKWENAAGMFRKDGVRTVMIRTGIVVSGDAGALPRMIKPVRLGIGSALGSGNQYIPWIHIEDLCNIYVKAIEDKSMEGAFNAVEPEHVTNRAFMQTLAKVLRKPFIFPDIPEVILKILYGEMADILLKGSRISSDKIVSSGYVFLFPDLERALRDLLPSL